MTIYITRTFPGKGINLLKQAGHDVVINELNRTLTNEELLNKLSKHDVHGILSMLTDQINTSILNAAPNLKVVANYAVGFDNIDISEARKRDIVVTNTPEVLTNAVAEHTIALMISLARRIPESDRYIRDGNWKEWQPDLMLGKELRGKTLGLVGVGRIGSRVAQIAHNGFGMKILYFDVQKNDSLEKESQAEKIIDLKDLLSGSDIVSLHVPLTTDTRHLLNKETIAFIKKDAYLINTSRGAVIEESALVDALTSNAIAGAALDVFEHEPQVSEGLTKLTNVILTPHTASATNEAREMMGELAAQSIIDVLAGTKPKNKVV